MFSVLMDGFPAGKSVSCKGMGQVDGVPEWHGEEEIPNASAVFAKWMTLPVKYGVSERSMREPFLSVHQEF